MTCVTSLSGWSFYKFINQCKVAKRNAGTLNARRQGGIIVGRVVYGKVLTNQNPNQTRLSQFRNYKISKLPSQESNLHCNYIRHVIKNHLMIRRYSIIYIIQVCKSLKCYASRSLSVFYSGLDKLLCRSGLKFLVDTCYRTYGALVWSSAGVEYFVTELYTSREASSGYFLSNSRFKFDLKNTL